MLAEHLRGTGAVAPEHVPHAAEETDFERVRESAGGREILRRLAEVAGEADDPELVAPERLPRDRDVLAASPSAS